MKGEITIEQAKDSQEDFNKSLKTIRRGNKTEEQKKTLANINWLSATIFTKCVWKMLQFN